VADHRRFVRRRLGAQALDEGAVLGVGARRALAERDPVVEDLTTGLGVGLGRVLRLVGDREEFLAPRAVLDGLADARLDAVEDGRQRRVA